MRLFLIYSMNKQVRKNLKMKEYDIVEEDAPIEEEMKELEKISEEIKQFEELYK